MSEKICLYCEKIYTGSTAKNTCYGCYGLLKKYGTTKPDHFNRKCEGCGEIFYKKKTSKFCCKDCYRKVLNNRKMLEYRTIFNIDLDKPKKYKAPNGSGHKDPHGYIYITKMRHPNSTKSGRIYEHTFVMSEYLGRPLKKGENVHHKNGVRNDNRIENLELWSTQQPPGQRVEDKIKWCKKFLKEYSETSLE